MELRVNREVRSWGTAFGSPRGLQGKKVVVKMEQASSARGGSSHEVRRNGRTAKVGVMTCCEIDSTASYPPDHQ